VITEHNFLNNINAIILEQFVFEPTVVLVGKHANLLRPKTQKVKMGWSGIYTFVNTEDLVWEYPKGIRPTANWPWPFRLAKRPPTVVIDGFELRNEGDQLLFRLPIDDRMPKYLVTKDKLILKAGNLKIEL
jgi:hypothetical protein